MKLNLKKVCSVFVGASYRDASWSYYTYLPDSCPAITKHFGVKDIKRCEDCVNKIIELKDVKIKPEKMNEFLFWYIKSGDKKTG